MAVKKIKTTYASGAALECTVVRDSDGYLLDNNDGAFKASATPGADFRVPLAESGSVSGLYLKDESRTVWNNGTYTIVIYLVGGSDPVGGEEMSIVADAEAAAPGTLTAKVQGLVKDVDGKLSDTDWANGIAGALGRYSKHRPKISVADIVGNGTHLYAVPAGWVEEFSSIESIELPIGENPPSFLDKDDDFDIYDGSGAEQIRLINDTPEATESFRVKFTVIRTEATIAANDLDAVANLAAHICLGMLASRYISSKKPAIQADSVNYQSKSGECSSRAKACLKFYNDHMNVKEDENAAPAVSVSSSTSNYPGGVERLTHARRPRNKRWS